MFRGFGTVLNVVTVIAGAGIGLLLGHRLPQRTRDVVTDGLGLTTLLIAALSAAAVLDPDLTRLVGTSGPVLVVLGALALGGIAGSLLRIEARLEGLGAALQRRLWRRAATTVPARRPVPTARTGAASSRDSSRRRSSSASARSPFSARCRTGWGSATSSWRSSPHSTASPPWPSLRRSGGASWLAHSSSAAVQGTTLVGLLAGGILATATLRLSRPSVASCWSASDCGCCASNRCRSATSCRRWSSRRRWSRWSQRFAGKFRGTDTGAFGHRTALCRAMLPHQTKGDVPRAPCGSWPDRPDRRYTAGAQAGSGCCGAPRDPCRRRHRDGDGVGAGRGEF